MTIGAGEIVKQAVDVAKPLTDTLSDAWLAVVGDRVAAWRLKNAAKLQIKVRSELGRLGVTLSQAHIPERYAFSWFEEATKQDEPEIQELFARLLAKAAAGDPSARDRRLLEIVSHLTPPDAAVMQYFYVDSDAKRMLSKETEEITDVEIDEYELFKALNDQYGRERWQSIEHLTAMGVIEKRLIMDPTSVFNAFSNLKTSSSGEVFPSYGSTGELEIKTLLASTVTGLALDHALAG